VQTKTPAKMEAISFSPVKSDVHIFIEKEQSMFDSTISKVFHDLKIVQLLNRANIIKRCGISPNRIIYDLFHIPFLMLTTVCMFVRNQFEEAISKDVYYRFLENANYNWHLFILYLSKRIENKVSAKTQEKEKKFFIVDDTITQVTGKLVESASYVYDHTLGKCVLGFKKLVIGIFSADRFIPIREKICVSATRPTKESKAIKYIKESKIEKIKADCPGAIERADLNKNLLEKTLSLLKEAKKNFRDVGIVLFDSWFSFNCFIIRLKSIDLDVICQLRNMPRTNKYQYKGANYTLNALYSQAKSKMRTVKKYGYKRATLCVSIPNTDISMKIIFIHNDGELNWHAFASTCIAFSSQEILEHYSKRWSIEVFFKNCKQHLNFGKEQMSNLDSIIASDALVFMRYLILTYLTSFDNTRWFEALEKHRMSHKVMTYGTRLLNYFMNQLKYMIDRICKLIEEGFLKEAIVALKEVFNPIHVPQLEFVNLK
jgi:hypothetical protein